MKPIYEMAVMNVRLHHPKAQDARVSSGDLRFRDTLREVLWRDYCNMVPPEEIASCREGFNEMWEHDWKPRFIPDLWWIDAENQTVHLFEIEDTHPLSQEKLLLLHNYWWHMDAISWNLTLIVFDRYGLNPRPLNLMEYAYHMLPVINREIKDAPDRDQE